MQAMDFGAPPAARAGWLGRLRVRARIMLGFTVVVALLVALTIVGVMAFDQVARWSRALVGSQGLAGLARDIKRDVVELRRNVDQFGVTGDRAYYTTASRMRVEVQSRIAGVGQFAAVPAELTGLPPSRRW